MRATELAHFLLRQKLKSGDFVVDATVGNGHDTLFLAERVGTAGRVLGFDIQKAALTQAAHLVGLLPQVTLVHAGHETLSEHFAADEEVAAVMFNLGYLPGGPKEIITRAETTLAALEQALAHIREGGLITITLYCGHEGGESEAEAVRSFLQKQPAVFEVNRHVRLNAHSPAPELIVVERLE